MKDLKHIKEYTATSVDWGVHPSGLVELTYNFWIRRKSFDDKKALLDLKTNVISKINERLKEIIETEFNIKRG